MYTITLADGSQITDLRLNGNVYISPTNIHEYIFENNLTQVAITDGETTEQYGLMKLAYFSHEGNETHFVITPLSYEELLLAKMRSNIDYIAMMSDIDILS